MKVLSWLVKARRTLTINELQEAVSIELDQDYIDETDLPDVSTLLDVCASLVIIDRNSKTLGLAHYTVQEYLLRNRIILDNEAEHLLTVGCLTFLSLGFNYHNISTGLVQYAAYHLGSHLKNCEESSTVDILLVFLKKLKVLRYRPDMSVDGDTTSILDLVWARYNTPLQSACILGHHAAVRRLLDEDPSTISVIDPINGFTALLAASSAGHEKIVDLLIANGANILFRTSKGMNALHIAVMHGHARVVSILLGQGGDQSIPDLAGLTPLDKALRGGNKEMVVSLLGYSAIPGMDIEMVLFWISKFPFLLYRGVIKFPPVHYAVILGKVSTVWLFLEEGWDVNFKGPEGRTALHLAASIGSSEMVELLLIKGASLSLYDDDEDTPLDKAIKSNYQVITQMINRGADVTTINANGRSSLDLAISEGSSEIVRLLTEKNAIPSATVIDVVTKIKEELEALRKVGRDEKAKRREGERVMAGED